MRTEPTRTSFCTRRGGDRTFFLGKKETYLGAYYQRLRKRMGQKKAIVALAHRMLVIISPLLNEQQPYRELGPGHAQEQAYEAAKRWAIRRLEQLGYQVSLQSVQVA